MKKTPHDIKAQKNQTPIVCLTAYSAPIARAANTHCDLLLVGDSVAMVLYGHDTTQAATMEMMAAHGKAVVTHAPDCLVVVDMPFGSYEQSKEQAVENAQKLITQTGADAVKLEGGAALADTIKHLVDNGVTVMGHIGLLPQSVNDASGFKVQGRGDDGAEALLNDALKVADAGAFCMVIEAVPESLAKGLTAKVSIPTIGIGASAACDGQILVTEDMLGLTGRKVPKFVKKFADLAPDIDSAIEQYTDEVKTRSFPSAQNTYKD